jgi:hypothetical protein
MAETIFGSVIHASRRHSVCRKMVLTSLRFRVNHPEKLCPILSVNAAQREPPILRVGDLYG